ncbi:MAG: hypothetical protein ACOC4E_00490 [Patescibacteria group bacterium]
MPLLPSRLRAAPDPLSLPPATPPRDPAAPTMLPQSLHGLRGFICVPQVALLATPQMSLDSCIARLSYGARVTHRRATDTWLEIESVAGTGWVPAASVTPVEALVLPHLSPGELYTAEQVETRKLRACIQDAALAGELQLPLQDLELAFYHLWRRGTRFTWPAERPRTAGRWHQILRGVRDVSMSIEPHTNAILEYQGNGTPGFLGIVTAVTPEQVITVASVGRTVAGLYQEETFSPLQWREWRPIFISCT